MLLHGQFVRHFADGAEGRRRLLNVETFTPGTAFVRC
jgi:hypothetical protein